METQSVAKLLALKFVRGCEKNRDMQALETFLTKHPHYIVPGDIYSAVVKAIANAYVPPLRKPTETDEERGWIDSLESGDHPSTRDGGGVAEKGENKRQQQGEKGDWLYTQAWALFHEMPRHGIARSKDVYDAMIELACKRASIKRALALFREMQHEAEREQREVRGFTHRTARSPHAATHLVWRCAVGEDNAETRAAHVPKPDRALLEQQLLQQGGGVQLPKRHQPPAHPASLSAVRGDGRCERKLSSSSLVFSLDCSSPPFYLP
jgi:pentatricopeptide repeat protein